MERKDLDLFLNIAETLFSAEENEPVLKPIDLGDLFEKLDLDLHEEGAKKKDFEAAIQGAVLNTPRTSTKGFFNQLFGGRIAASTTGELLAVLLNHSMYTYKVGGPMVGAEKVIIRKMIEMLNYGSDADGTMAPGGSMSNMMGMLMARDWKDQESRTSGVTNKMILYTSSESHYSIAKNAAFIGIGREQVRKISTDNNGRMDIRVLINTIEADKKKGGMPFMVNSTAGTTVLGAYDPLREISSVCAEHQLWHHVDGALGGSAIFSEQYKHLLKGIEHSDSVTINAHKMLGVPLPCSMIFAKQKEFLHKSFSNDAEYLYQTHDDEINLGKISLQSGRRYEALKLRTLWKSIGRKGLEAMVDHEFQLAAMAREYVANHEDYILYNHMDSISVCFNYKKINPRMLCNRLYEEGELMVGYGKFQKHEFIRFVTVNGTNDEETIKQFFSTLEEFAAKHFD